MQRLDDFPGRYPRSTSLPHSIDVSDEAALEALEAKVAAHDLVISLSLLRPSYCCHQGCH